MTRSTARLVAAGAVALAAVVVLVALGSWQVKRLGWKRELIAQVEARVHAAPVAAPGPAEWARVDAATAQYRNVRLIGRYLDGQALVQASTVRGPGWWVLTPLREARGFVVLVNRGFVAERHAPPQPGGEVRVTGLLRISEPGGGFLRRNDAQGDRWYSRDVTAIAQAKRLGTVAPYFVDADALSSPAPGPVGGLTVLSFPNNHLGYALTWYALAALVVVGFIVFVRAERRTGP